MKILKLFTCFGFIVICFFSCKKTDLIEKLEVGKQEDFPTARRGSDGGEGRTLKDILFSDHLDFDNAILQTSAASEYSRELVPFFKKPEDEIFKYVLIETDGTNIFDFEYIVSDQSITDIDLFEERIYHDSVLVRATNLNSEYSYEIGGHVNDETLSLDVPLARLEIPCFGGLACIEWYIVVKERVTGFIVSETFVGETCYSCGGNPDETGGGGGNNANQCLVEQENNFNQTVDRSSVASNTEYVSVYDIAPFKKHKDPVWKILDGAGVWQLKSQEIGIIKLVDVANDVWNWESLTHGAISMEGSTLPGVSVSYSQGVGTPSLGELHAGMSLNFSVTYTFVCNCPNLPLLGWVPPVNKSYNATSLWDAKPF